MWIGCKVLYPDEMRGQYEVYQHIFHIVAVPLETPIRNLRPSRDICETCHGPASSGEQ